MNNTDSLRTQIIEAMKADFNNNSLGVRDETGYMEHLFDKAIMPVLDAAMKAGELLVHRATVPQKPVSEHIMDWLDACCLVAAKMRSLEQSAARASRRELLKVLYDLEQNAIKALADARAIEKNGTPKDAVILKP